MKEYISNIKSILDEMQICEGDVIDTSNSLQEKELGDTLAIQQVALEDVRDFLISRQSTRAIIINQENINKENQDYFVDLRNMIYDTKIVLLVCGNSIISKNNIFELLSGKMTSPLDIKGYTMAGIKEYMSKKGYDFLTERKEYGSSSDVESDNIFLTQGSLINEYLVWLDQYVNAELEVQFFVHAYLAKEGLSEKETERGKKLFLSVITRTQGRRPEALRETLLSLAGQDSSNFEVLIMGHNLNGQETKLVTTIIDESPLYLKERMRFVPIKGGNRSTPINKGFEQAKGTYAVILDDDDIVFDNWVSSFEAKAKEFFGSVLHAYVIAQDWEVIKTQNGKEMLRSCGTPINQFCKKFNYLKELRGNYCPVMGLAFPLYPYRTMGMCFDESLNTTEDWDYLMRISSICGVVDIKEPTSIYRLWKNFENSASLHHKNEWDANRKKIQKKMTQKPLNIPAKYVDGIIQLIEKHPEFLGEEREQTVGQATPLYFDNGHGYNETCVKRIGSSLELPNICYKYTQLRAEGKISSIRWDPYESGNVFVDNINIEIITAEGKVIQKTTSQLHTNGFKTPNGITFFHPDPQIIIRFTKPLLIDKVIISGSLGYNISEERHNYLSMQHDSNILRKTKKAVKLVGKKIMKR